jgi:hypothetical protein
MRRTERRKRGSFDFVKEGKLQKQAQIGRLRVRSRHLLPRWADDPQFRHRAPWLLAACPTTVPPLRQSQAALHACAHPCGASCRQSMAMMQ